MSDSPRTISYQSNQPGNPPRPTCAKCGEKMDQGVIAGAAGQFWVAGEIRRTFFRVRMPRGRLYEIIVFRCVGCGFLESYSPPG